MPALRASNVGPFCDAACQVQQCGLLTRDARGMDEMIDEQQVDL